MSDLTKLQPAIVWQYFSEILEIPRPSKKEEKIIQYLIEFGNKLGLPTKKDEAGNVLISKPASPGKESVPTLILQSHVDMVCEKNRDIEHDFETDPIKAYIDGEWVTAEGTTLGADDGIGVAAQLAILASKDLEHGPIECLFTTDEETGLTGAFALKPGFLTGKTLLNLDSEDEGELFIGCAGGIDTIARFKYKKERLPKKYVSVQVMVSGLKGGHSGDEIHKGLGNSNKILARFLWEATEKLKIRLHDFDGGNLRNAIPREASALIAVAPQRFKELRELMSEFKPKVLYELEITEPELKLVCQDIALPAFAIDKKTQRNLLQALLACPHGVKTMSSRMPGMVETSTNLASVKFKHKKIIEITTSQRSDIDSAKKMIATQVRCVFELAGAKVRHTDGYPGWAPNPESHIKNITVAAYRDLFKVEPVVRSIHAGLECGLFKEKYPELDMISFGPTLRNVHSPDERIHIGTVQKFWDLLLEVLKRFE